MVVFRGEDEAPCACREEGESAPLGCCQAEITGVGGGEIGRAEEVEGEAEEGVGDCHAGGEEAGRARIERGRE